MGYVRVISGKCKGKKLLVPERMKVRPLLARVKKSVFSIIENKLQGATFLDLFSGIGSIGIEALSRGAKKVVFVESNKEIAEFLKKNIKLTGFFNQTIVYKENVFKICSKLNEQFDVVFIDPPYEKYDSMRLLSLFKDGNLVKENGLVLLHHFYLTKVPAQVGTLNLITKRRYGQNMVSFYEKKEITDSNLSR